MTDHTHSKLDIELILRALDEYAGSCELAVRHMPEHAALVAEADRARHLAKILDSGFETVTKKVGA